MVNNVLGAEGIVIHGDKIVLGMQKKKRWYILENGEKAAIVKTLGGAIEDIDKNNTRNALIREILEEVKDIKEKDINVSEEPIFTKEIEMRELNPYEQDSTLKMKADFYAVEITENIELKPNDLPALIEIPIDEFLKISISTNLSLHTVKNYIIKSKIEAETPKNCATMLPKEIQHFLEEFMNKIEKLSL